MSKDKLKPCPFCGVVPELDKNEDNMYDIACKNLKCLFRPSLPIYYNRKSEAIRTWNKRAKKTRR